MCVNFFLAYGDIASEALSCQRRNPATLKTVMLQGSPGCIVDGYGLARITKPKQARTCVPHLLIRLRAQTVNSWLMLEKGLEQWFPELAYT